MITEDLIKKCQAFDKSEYGEDKTMDEIKIELEKLEQMGCVVEHIMHCPNCPKFGTGKCPIV